MSETPKPPHIPSAAIYLNKPKPVIQPPPVQSVEEEDIEPVSTQQEPDVDTTLLEEELRALQNSEGNPSSSKE